MNDSDALKTALRNTDAAIRKVFLGICLQLNLYAGTESIRGKAQHRILRNVTFFGKGFNFPI